MTYLATVNTPGYLAEDDEPATFDTAREAWEYLADDRKRWEDDEADENFEGYSTCANQLECASNGTLGPDDLGLDHDLTGSIFGMTPGYGGHHDLGRAYTVTLLTD